MEPTDEHAAGLALSSEDYHAVHAAVTAVAGTWAGGQPATLNSLFAHWRVMASEVEEGYSCCAPEFDNDIWCRSALAQAWPMLPTRVQAIRRPELDGIDERYRRATVPWPGQPEHGAGWWTRRVPRRLEVETSEQRKGDWPLGWETMPFPRPDSVEVVSWH
ncbi:hypothetical protein [Embleya sp. NPDC005575]|uniref:hypothetical protein n=1 Tax=Embleya sp. NPDC005575 TaxID=3156892 RepID=UPI0033B6E1B4